MSPKGNGQKKSKQNYCHNYFIKLKFHIIYKERNHTEGNINRLRIIDVQKVNKETWLCNINKKNNRTSTQRFLKKGLKIA